MLIYTLLLFSSNRSATENHWCNEQFELLQRSRDFQSVVDNLRQHLHDYSSTGYTEPYFRSVHFISGPQVEKKDYVTFHDQHQRDFFGVIDRRLRRYIGYGF